jgi:hypothetical protein
LKTPVKQTDLKEAKAPFGPLVHLKYGEFRQVGRTIPPVLGKSNEKKGADFGGEGAVSALNAES